MYYLFQRLKRIVKVKLLHLKMSMALPRAVMKRHVRLVKRLLDRGEDPNESPLGISPLILAVLVSDNEIVKLLISNPSTPANPNVGDEKRGELLIHYAVQECDVALAELLLTESLIKVDVNAVGPDGCTPLALAVKMKNTVIVKMLLEAESDPNICDNDGCAPIYHAIQHGDIEMVQLLLDKSLIKLDVNISYGCSPLSFAVKMKNFTIVKLLLEAEADPNVIDSNGYATIHYAVYYRDIAIVKLLLTESFIAVNVNFEQRKGNTPLIIAIRQNNTAIASLLIEAGADINFISNMHGDYQYTPFIQAVCQENLNMCKFLVKHGYDVNVPILHKRVYHSAVHLAAVVNVDIVRFLVEKCKADIFKEPGRLIENIIGNERPEVLDYLLHYAYKQRGDEVWWDYNFPGPLHEALNHQAVACISVLLRWGLNNAVFNIPVMDLGYILHHFSTLFPSRHISISTCITVIKLFIYLYPQSLQDTWFIENRNINEFSFPPEMKKFLIEQYRERKNPFHLNVICRTKIFQQLGYNPIPKAEKLPLPRSLIHFVQFQDVEDLHNYVPYLHRL